MAAKISKSSAYEAEANRLRAQIAATMGALRSGLTPSNLASEAASSVGLADLSWGGAFDYAAKRHPIPTAIVGFGVALWTMSAIRNRGQTRSSRSCKRAFERNVGLDCRVGDEGVSGASRRETARVCRRRSVAGCNGSANALRRDRQKAGDHYRPRSRRDQCSPAHRILGSGRPGGCARGAIAETVPRRLRTAAAVST